MSWLIPLGVGVALNLAAASGRRLAGHLSDVRLVTFMLGLGDWVFDLLQPSKATWTEGEVVEVDWIVRNGGTATIGGKIEIYDNSTNQLLCTWNLPVSSPGTVLSTNNSQIYLIPYDPGSALKMPNRNMTLRFEMTP